MESTNRRRGGRRGLALKAGVCAAAVVVTVGALAVLRLARSKGPDSAGASAQTADGAPRSTPRDPAAPPTTQELKDATMARDALRSYFARIAGWKIDRALDLCHATTGDEQLLATGLAEYSTVQYACREQVKQKFGAPEARRVFARVFTAADFKTAKAYLKGDHAEVVFDDGQHWPMVKVEGHWKLSMFDYAVSQRRGPAALAAAYTEAVKVHMAVGRELREGKYKSADEFERALADGMAKASGQQLAAATTKPAGKQKRK
jgi:hypothetical protein